MSTPSLFDQVIQSLPATEDLIVNRISNTKFEVLICYYSPMCDEAQMQERIIKPFLSSDQQEQFDKALLTYGAKNQTSLSELSTSAIDGHAILVVGTTIYTMKVIKQVNTQPLDIAIENTVLGPQKAFAENLMTNVNIIRSRYPKVDLRVESCQIGQISQTKVMTLYDDKLVNRSALDEVRQRLKKVKIDVLQAAGQLEVLLNGKRYSLFPTMIITERPDRVTLNLAKGKIILLVDGSSYALVLPAVFFDFMSAMDDLYNSFWASNPMKILRYIGLILTISLPAVYISIVSYNPEIMRVQLTLSIAGSRAAVPYPSFYEVLLMLFLIEALTEASLRLPRTIGATATTVGGLILGQAAQQAGLVSSIMIIVASVVAIANFVIPINVMSLSMRIVKYSLIVFATFFGIVGTTIGMILLLGYLTRQRSYGDPYLRISIGERRTSRSSGGNTVR